MGNIGSGLRRQCGIVTSSEVNKKLDVNYLITLLGCCGQSKLEISRSVYNLT